MDGLAVKPLTVDFHEGGFLDKLNQESKLGFWSQLSDDEKKQAGSPWGPQNPQTLNRYSYVQNNPLKYTDPSGHDVIFWGLTVRAGAGFGGSVSAGIIQDDKGGYGLYLTLSGGAMQPGGVGGGITIGGTNQDTILNARGGGRQIGSDGDIFSADAILTHDGEIIGGAFGLGLGFLLDVHGEETLTFVLPITEPGKMPPPPNPCPSGRGRCNDTPLPPTSTPSPASTPVPSKR